MKNKKRAACYARVSTNNESQDSSYVIQKYIFKQFAEDNDLIITHYYQDRKTGTKTLDRDGYNEMKSDLTKDLFDVVLIKHSSRLSRDQIEAKTFAKLAKKK